MQILFLLFSFVSAFEINESQLNSIAHSKEWRQLYDYQDQGKYTFSDLNSEFFISPNGATDPEGELKAFLKALKSQDLVFGPEKRDLVQCVFPARYEFLRQQISDIKSIADLKNCHDLNAWKAGLNIDSVSLMFSTAYATSPPSMFGHTFLKLNSENRTETSKDLLSYAVNFAADTQGETNGLIFAYRGLFGLYPGIYTIGKYYAKVNEYNYSESRDLWEYELNLSLNEIDRLTNFLWELYRTSYRDYYFFKKNCSYYLLDLIDYARPSLNLRKHFESPWPWTYTLPGETIYFATQQKDLVKEVRYRPSLRRSTESYFESLTDSQKKLFNEFQKNSDEPIPSDPQVLKSLVHYYDFLKVKESANPNPKTLSNLRKLLIALSKIQTEHGKESTNLIPPNNRPDWMVGVSRFGAGLASLDGHQYLNLNSRPALHSLLSSDLGFEENSSLEVFDLNVWIGKSIFLRQLTILDTQSFVVNRGPITSASWMVNLKYIPNPYGPAEAANSVAVQGGLGESFSIAKNTNWYAMGLAANYLGGVERGSGVTALGARVGLRSQWLEHSKLHLSSECQKPVMNEASNYLCIQELSVAFFNYKNYELILKLNHTSTSFEQNTIAELGLAALYF